MDMFRIIKLNLATLTTSAILTLDFDSSACHSYYNQSVYSMLYPHSLSMYECMYVIVMTWPGWQYYVMWKDILDCAEYNV